MPHRRRVRLGHALLVDAAVGIPPEKLKEKELIGCAQVAPRHAI